MANGDLKGETPPLTLKPHFSLTQYGETLDAEIIAKIRESDIFVAEISDNNPNVLLELGVGLGCGLIPVILKSSAARDSFRIPTDITGRLRLEYDDPTTIVGLLADRLKTAAITRARSGSGDALEAPRRTWNLGEHIEGLPISIIAASSATPSPFRVADSPDYIYLDNLSDKDTLLSLGITLGRLFPRAHLRFYSADNVPAACLEDHIVLVGGTGTPGEPNNHVAAELIERLGLAIGYPDDDTLTWAGQSFHVERAPEGIRRDWGLFARLENPFRRDRLAFLVQGVHTFGVLGAARSLSIDRDAFTNHKLLATLAPGTRSVVTVLPVDVVRGRVLVARLSAEQISPLSDSTYSPR